MNNRNYGLYAVALAIVVVGALWLGVPVGTLALLGLLLVCPLMMVFMMRGMHGGGHEPPPGTDEHRHGPAEDAGPRDRIAR